MAKNRKERSGDSFINRELGGMVLTLTCAVLFFCMATGNAVFYPLGGSVQKFMLGVVGFFGYPLTLFGLLIGISAIIGKKIVRGRGVVKAVALGVFTVTAFVILQLATGGPINDFNDYMSHCYRAAENGVGSSTYGGVIFGLIAFALKSCLSVAGAYIFCALVILLCLLLIFKELIFRNKKSANADKNAGLAGDKQNVGNETATPADGNKSGVYASSAPRRRSLIVGDNRFDLKTASDYSAINARKRSEEILGKSSGYTDEKPTSSVYSDEYNRGYGESEYAKTPRRINPDSTIGDYSDYSKAQYGDVSSRSEKVEYPSDDADEPIENVYIPENYKDAVKKMNPDTSDAYGSDIEREIESEILNGVNVDASDSEIVDVSGGFGDSHEERPNAPSTEDLLRPRREFVRKPEAIKPEPKETPKIRPIVSGGDDSDSEEGNPYDEMPLDFKYNPPPLDLFKSYKSVEDYGKIEYFKQEKATTIMNTLKVLGGVNVRVENIVHGPTITRFDLAIPDDVSIKNIMKYADDLKLRLKTASEIRFATIPKTPFIGVEVPNDVKSTVGLRDVLESEVFVKAKSSSLTFAIGKDIVGNPVVADITKMPHLLIAGSTGTGKSVGLNSLLVSLMYKYSPQELRFIIVDPKQVEFTIFAGIPHMYFDEILCDAPKTVAMLNWAVKEMEDRYTKLKNAVVRNIDEYNDQIDPRRERKMPRIVIIIDEFADLMSVEKKNIEEKIARIAQKARAAGMYLILATQRPDVKIIEGSIKTNFTSRMAFKMSNAVDSTTILGEAGAEKLLGAGDLLYKTSTMTNVERAQGAFISTEEIKNVVKYIKDHNRSYFNDAALRSITKESSPQVESVNGKGGAAGGGLEGMVSEDYIRALKVAVQVGTISISLLQRKLSFGYPKAAKIVDWMTEEGYVVTSQAGKQKQVTMTMDEFIEKFGDV